MFLIRHKRHSEHSSSTNEMIIYQALASSSRCCRVGINLKVFDLLSNSEKPLDLPEIARETNADIVLTGERKIMRVFQSSFYIRPLNEICRLWVCLKKLPWMCSLLQMSHMHWPILVSKQASGLVGLSSSHRGVAPSGILLQDFPGVIHVHV